MGRLKNISRKLLRSQKKSAIENGKQTSMETWGMCFIILNEKAKEYYEKALAISKEIGDRQGEATVYGNLGNRSRDLGEYGKAKGYYSRALAISKKIGNVEKSLYCVKTVQVPR